MKQIQRRRGFALTSVRRFSEALPILKEAVSFTIDSDPQLVHFYSGICYQALSETAPAKEAFLRAIRLGLDNQFEADARYRLAILYFTSRAFAQAKFQLETALQIPGRVLARNFASRFINKCRGCATTWERPRKNKSI